VAAILHMGQITFIELENNEGQKYCKPVNIDEI
jgi:hypothetical protein